MILMKPNYTTTLWKEESAHVGVNTLNPFDNSIIYSSLIAAIPGL